MASAQSSPLHDLSGSSGYRMCTKHAACRDLQAPRLRLADVARDATIRGVDALCVCGEFVCLRSNVFILHIDSRFSNTQPHDETPTPGRAVLPYRVRADTRTYASRVIRAHGLYTDAPSLGCMEEQPHGEDSLSTTQTHCTGPGRAHVVCRTIRLYTSTRPTESRSPGPLASDLSSLELSFPLTRCRSTRRSGGHPL